MKEARHETNPDHLLIASRDNYEFRADIRKPSSLTVFKYDASSFFVAGYEYLSQAKIYK